MSDPDGVEGTQPAADAFVTVAQVGEVPEGEGRTVLMGERPVALFLYQGEYLAIDDLCPHQGASLGAGAVQCFDDERTEQGAEPEGPTVACPWHAWRFRLRDGCWADSPRLSVDVFETRVNGTDVQVRLKQA